MLGPRRYYVVSSHLDQKGAASQLDVRGNEPYRIGQLAVNLNQMQAVAQWTLGRTWLSVQAERSLEA